MLNQAGRQNRLRSDAAKFHVRNKGVQDPLKTLDLVGNVVCQKAFWGVLPACCWA